MIEKSSPPGEIGSSTVNPEQTSSGTSMLLSVMTFNLHRDRLADGTNSWEHRRDVCATLISKFAPLVVCTQEGLKSQLEDLATALPGYEQFGVSRKGPGDPDDEHCAIFYAGDKVEKVDGGTFWLSDSPEVPYSNSWKSGSPCITTWATFQLKEVQQPGFAFQILCTHLDRNSSRARRRGALLIWQHIATLPPNLPVIFCGTFNTVKESAPGRFLLGRTREHGITGDLKDGWAAARQRHNDAIVYTEHGFKGAVILLGSCRTYILFRVDVQVAAKTDPWLSRTFCSGESRGAKEIFKLIFMALCLCWDRQNQDLHVDWVLFRGRALAPVYSEIVNYNVNGRYPSDHYPLYVEFMLPRTVVRIEEELN